MARREGSVLVFNRFTNEQVGEITLPGPARALRMGPFGRWLLVNPPSADSLWLVDLSSNTFVAGFETEWSSDLPTVTNQQLLLLKSGGDLVAVDLTQSKMTVTGTSLPGRSPFDGAGPNQLLWHVTLPGLRPAILVALLFRAVDAFRVFDLIYVLTAGGPGTATEYAGSRGRAAPTGEPGGTGSTLRSPVGAKAPPVNR